MSKTEKDITEGVLTTGNFTIQAQLGKSGKTLTVSGYIYSTNTVEDINKQIDIYHDVVDRQQSRAEIPELQAKLEQRVRSLHQLKDHLANMKTKRDAGERLTSQEKKQLGEIETNIQVIQKDIDEGIQVIAETKAKFTKG